MNQGEQPLINGVAATRLSVDDRALAYGDGLFETIAWLERGPQHWDAHFARLRDGAQRLGIACPAEHLWREDIERAARGLPEGDRAVLKLVLTRGEGRRGYAPPEEAQPTRIVAFHAWPAPDDPAAGFEVIECGTRLGINPTLAGIKHLNRLEQVLGAQEVVSADAREGIMCNVRGEIIAGTSANLFLVRRRRVLTPPVTECGIAGIVRQALIDNARRLGLRVEQRRLGNEDLAACDELFFTGSLRGIRSAQRLCLRHATRDLEVELGAALRADARAAGLIP